MSKPLTGRKVLLVAVGAFGIIIAVNLFMAFKAIGTFPGLEVKNSYVASQSFDGDRAAQEALGWVVEPSYEDGVLTILIRDRAGLPARVADLHATVGRTTHVRDDVEPDFSYKGGLFIAPVQLASGAWLIHLEAKASDGTAFRQRLDLNVKG
ncbi:MAG: FixH family protein [Paracoccaceae bacterium]|jgi:nitrogen fixation protein FixH|nr:FixH family protein [Paracoccaceae bacterium]